MTNLTSFSKRYFQINRKKYLFIGIFSLIAISFIIITLGFGVYDISIGDAVKVFIDHINDNIVDRKGDIYVWEMRLPRGIAAMFIGAGLAIGGVVMQNVMNNPLAEPYTIGVSSGAFLGATLSMILGFSIIPFLDGEYATIANAFVFSLIPVTIILALSKFKKLSSTAIILLGIAVMYVFSSITQFLMVTTTSEKLSEVYNWRVGSLAKVTWDNLPYIVVIVAVLSIILMLLYKKLDVMYSGDRTAQTLGENPSRIRIVSLTIVSLMTAGIVSFTGTIGFIGLVGPHIARIFVGSNNKYLIPASAAVGAAFLIIADTIAKVSGVNGLPVGVISSMVGGPLFLYILIKQRKKVWN